MRLFIFQIVQESEERLSEEEVKKIIDLANEFLPPSDSIWQTDKAIVPEDPWSTVFLKYVIKFYFFKMQP